MLVFVMSLKFRKFSRPYSDLRNFSTSKILGYMVFAGHYGNMLRVSQISYSTSRDDHQKTQTYHVDFKFKHSELHIHDLRLLF